VKATLKSFVVVVSILGLIAYIAYAVYQYPELLKENFNTVLSIAIAIANAAILKWLFGEEYEKNNQS